LGINQKRSKNQELTMPYRVELETKARKEFLKLSKEIQLQLAPVIEDLQKDPRPPGTKKLRGGNGYRIRQGSYRILFTVEDRQKKIRIYRIGHRRDIYR
jgi:mRNA interferase RelE/StbE